MIYTNKTLEFCNNRRGERVIELCNNYGQNIIVQADKNLNPKIKSIKNRFHLALDMVEYQPGKFRIVMDEKKRNTYLILNSKDDCNFQFNGKIFYDDKVEVKRTFYFNNRDKSCQWELSILKLVRDTKKEPAILVVKYTTGRLEYIIIDNGKVQHFNHEQMVHHYPKLIDKAKEIMKKEIK